MSKPSDILNEHRPLIREIMLQFRIKIRVFLALLFIKLTMKTAI